MRYTGSLGVHLEYATAHVTHKKLGDHGEVLRPHELIYPHELFSAAYAAGDTCFGKMFLGDSGEAGLADFWERQKDTEWVKDHPGFKTFGAEYRHAIPVGVHADKGQHIARDKMLCISWGSCMSRESTDVSKQLFSLVPDEFIVKGKTEEELYAILVLSPACPLHYKHVLLRSLTEHVFAVTECKNIQNANLRRFARGAPFCPCC
jgi:hypothetical protein